MFQTNKRQSGATMDVTTTGRKGGVRATGRNLSAAKLTLESDITFEFTSIDHGSGSPERMLQTEVEVSKGSETVFKGTVQRMLFKLQS